MTNARRPLVAGNWKMNGLRADGLALATALAGRARQSEPSCEILICPPATLLASVAERLGGSPVRLGAQDCHPKSSGAHTGDLSAAMIRDAGCSHVILGHSERRADHHETNALVRAKAAAALAQGLTAIICVGETESQRDAGSCFEVVGAQLKGSIPAEATPANLIVAYEPVWAIGTGRTPTNDEVAAVHAHLRAGLAGLLAQGDAVRILYGGSVKPGNAREFLALADVDGALVGGASLSAEDFWAIVEAA
ncbi:MAG TPA: triose-phosphate isomerase [Aliidongia sp.]|nr:triose-phosphate isomerase [Aliidongia sp.]